MWKLNRSNPEFNLIVGGPSERVVSVTGVLVIHLQGQVAHVSSNNCTS